MSALEKRLSRLEGIEPELTQVVTGVPHYWSKQRKIDESTALALAAGGQPPFSFVFVTEYFGEGGPTDARLISMGSVQ